METGDYNYNNEEKLNLYAKDLIKNKSLIEDIYKGYEILEGEIIIRNLRPVLVINGYTVARVRNDISTPQKLSSLEIKQNNVYAYIKKRLGI